MRAIARPVVFSPMNTKELYILIQLASGQTQAQLAKSMGVTINTLKNQMKWIRWRLLAKNTTHAVAIAIRSELI